MLELIDKSKERNVKYAACQNQIYIPTVSEKELEQRIRGMEQVLNIVDGCIVQLLKVLRDKEYTLGFVDSEGIILRVYRCSEKYTREFAPGKIWTEETVGATSIGIAISTRKVTVFRGKEHNLSKFKSVFAVSYPIIQNDKVLGVMNLAMNEIEGFEYLVNLIGVLVSRIEEQLLIQTTFGGSSEEFKGLEQIFRTFMHEIRNPLANIRAFMQLQQRKAEDRAPFDRMVKEIDLMVDMIENFRYFSLEKDFTMKRLNLTAMIKGIHTVLKNTFELKGWEFEISVPPEDCYVLGSENKLNQVFLNILKNAYEAIDEDGRVHMCLEQNDQCYVIKISDNGQGIDVEKQKLIFKPFYTTKPEGYGLGLAVCREILGRHSGDIEIRSEKDRGTIVKVSLPIYVQDTER